METAYRVGIYCRLSREDDKNELRDVSMSIENQQAYIQEYVAKMDWTVFDIYIDDGISGTRFDRPALQRMIKDTQHGLVNCVVVKDLSRLARDRLIAGRLREDFIDRGIRFTQVFNGIYEIRTELPTSNHQQSLKIRDLLVVYRVISINARYMAKLNAACI